MKKLMWLLMVLWSSFGWAQGVESVVGEQLGDRRIEIVFQTHNDEPLVSVEGNKLTVTWFDCEASVEPQLFIPSLVGRGCRQEKGRCQYEFTFRHTLKLVSVEPVLEGWLVRLDLQLPLPQPRPTIVAPLQGKVTLTATKAPLSKVVQMIADQLGYNLVVDDGEQDKLVTLKVVQAPAEETLNLLVSGSSLSWALVGKTLVVGPRSQLASNLGQVNLSDFRVYHGDVQAMAESLKGLLGEGSTVVADPRSRRLFVSGDAQVRSRAQKALAQMDVPLEQVAIKARIVEVSDQATDELEGLLAAVYRQFFALFDGVKSSLAYTTVNMFSEMPQLAQKASKALDLRLNALIGQGKAKLLADPMVVTFDGQEAVIKLIDRVKYISGRDEGKNPSYIDEEVGPQLKVTPYVDGNGGITVKLELRTGEITQWKRGSQGEELPQISEREVVTQVRMIDGQPFVVGGLFKESRSETVNKFPLLGDLPLVGFLFRSRSVKNERGQVIMILTPYILP